MERETSVRATKPCRNRVQYAEDEIRRESEFTRVQGTTTRAPVQSRVTYIERLNFLECDRR